MKSAWLAGAGLLVLAAQPAGAAGPPIVQAPIFNWTGFYVGAHAGRGWGNTKHCDEPDDACTPVFDIDGLVGGATVGLNWQYASWVFGVEADRSFGTIDGSVPTSLQFGCGAPCVTEVRGFATVRGRAGPTFDRLFVYGTAGYAFGELFGEVSETTNRARRTGWTAGAGVEYAFTSQISVKLEYLHVRLGSILSDPTGPYTTYGNFNVVRGGLNYRFATGEASPPVGTGR
jgi:outer membrane immunogenic protein